MITGNGYSLKRFPLLLLLFWIRFLTAFKREKKNYGVSPPWLAGNNPLLLFCASFFSKASEFSFLKVFNSIFEDTLKRAATVTLTRFQGLCSSFPLPLLINLLFGLVDRVWKAHPRAGKKVQMSSEGSRKRRSGGVPQRKRESSQSAVVRRGRAHKHDSDVWVWAESDGQMSTLCAQAKRVLHWSRFLCLFVCILRTVAYCGPWLGVAKRKARQVGSDKCALGFRCVSMVPLDCYTRS